jgi:hypothetical protein
LVDDVQELVLDFIGCKLVEVIEPGKEQAEVSTPLTLVT